MPSASASGIRPAIVAPTARVAASSTARVVIPRWARKSATLSERAGDQRVAAAVEPVGERRDRHPGDDPDRDPERGEERDLLRRQAPVGEPERPERHVHAGHHEERHVDRGGVGGGRGSKAERGEGQVADEVARPDLAGAVLDLDEPLGPGEAGDRGPSLRRRRPRPGRRRSSRARRYSRRPGRLRFSKAAGSARPRGSRQGAPASRRSAGRAKTSVQTKAATGLPGSPKTGRPRQRPSASGRPGFTAIRQVASAPRAFRSAATWSSSPAEAPPLVRIASAAAPRSSAAATASGSSGRVAEVDGLHLPAPQDLEQHRPVGVEGLVRRRGRARRRGSRRRSRAPPPSAAAAPAASREPGRRRERQVGRPEQPALAGRIAAPAATSSPAAPGVRAGLGRALEAHALAGARRVLVEHDGVDALRQQRAGQDPHRLARRHRAGEGRAGGRAARRPAAARAAPPRGSRARSRSRRPRRSPPAGSPAPPSPPPRGCARRRRRAARLGLGDRRDRRLEPRQRLVDRHPVDPRRQREAVVAQPRRRRRARAPRHARRRGSSPPRGRRARARRRRGRARPSKSGASPPSASSAASARAVTRTCTRSRIAPSPRSARIAAREQRGIDLGEDQRRLGRARGRCRTARPRPRARARSRQSAGSPVSTCPPTEPAPESCQQDLAPSA